MAQITIKKINNELVQPLKGEGKPDNRPVLGYELFPEPYANIFLCARKKSGKTVVIQKIIRECALPNFTTIIAFCSTLHKDSNWQNIMKYCKKHHIKFEGMSSLKEGKIDYLKLFIETLQREGEEKDLDESSEEENPPLHPMRKKTTNFFDSESSEDEDEEKYYEVVGKGNKVAQFQYGITEPEDVKINPQKIFDSSASQSSMKKLPKFKAPEYMLIFDDLSDEIKSPSLIALLKKNRHYKMKCIMSSQYPNDLKPESLMQMDYWLLFKNISVDKLQKVKKDSALTIDFDLLEKIYHDATKDPFGFLYIDTQLEQYRKNFDKLYEIKSS